MSIPQKADPEKSCVVCGEPLTRKRFASGRLEDRGVFLRRTHCSQRCANTRSTVTKSAHHYRAQKHREETCEECGTTSALHVHHKDRNPSNDAVENLATLCGSCHLKLHWREDRERRLAAIRSGADSRRRSAGGRAF